jgi:hypothetical protein
LADTMAVCGQQRALARLSELWQCCTGMSPEPPFVVLITETNASSSWRVRVTETMLSKRDRSNRDRTPADLRGYS